MHAHLEEALAFPEETLTLLAKLELKPLMLILMLLSFTTSNNNSIGCTTSEQCREKYLEPHFASTLQSTSMQEGNYVANRWCPVVP